MRAARRRSPNVRRRRPVPSLRPPPRAVGPPASDGVPRRPVAARQRPAASESGARAASCRDDPAPNPVSGPLPCPVPGLGRGVRRVPGAAASRASTRRRPHPADRPHAEAGRCAAAFAGCRADRIPGCGPPAPAADAGGAVRRAGSNVCRGAQRRTRACCVRARRILAGRARLTAGFACRDAPDRGPCGAPRRDASGGEPPSALHRRRRGGGGRGALGDLADCALEQHAGGCRPSVDARCFAGSG